MSATTCYTREGRVLVPFLAEGYERFNMDDEEDWERGERLVAEIPELLAAIGIELEETGAA